MSNVNSTQIIPTVFSLMLMLLNPKLFFTLQLHCFPTMRPIREIFFGQIQKVELQQRRLLDGGTAVFGQKYCSIPTEILQYSDRNIIKCVGPICEIFFGQICHNEVCLIGELQYSDRNKCVGPICEMCGRAELLLFGKWWTAIIAIYCEEIL